MKNTFTVIIGYLFFIVSILTLIGATEALTYSFDFEDDSYLLLLILASILLGYYLIKTKFWSKGSSEASRLKAENKILVHQIEHEELKKKLESLKS